LHVGQVAGLRFSAFNQRTTPEITGTLTRISADVSQDQRSGQSYYIVRIGISPEEIARLGNVKLVPGMPVEAFIKTYDPTVISYFTKPLHDQILRAFRER
jgi:HlyD family secretion protein